MWDQTKCFLLDLDGTVYIENELIGDMARTLQIIRESGRKIVYLTNNSSKDEIAYKNKLKMMGIWDERDGVYTSGMATAEYLNAHYKGASVYLVGTAALSRAFIQCGIRLVDDKPDIVVLSYDTELTYAKLIMATKWIAKGSLYIATHPDINCPAQDVFLPDIGSFIKLIEASTGKLPAVICGKPYCVMGECVVNKLGFSSNQFVVVGDRLHTDIQFAVNNHFLSLLVFSGETTREMYAKSAIRATYVLPSLNDIEF